MDKLILKKDINVQEKKFLLIKKLHELIKKTFSIKKGSFKKSHIGSARHNADEIRKIVDKLRSINHYIETELEEESKPSKFRIESPKAESLSINDTRLLEYFAYNMIKGAQVLDGKLISQFVHDEKKELNREMPKIKGVEIAIKKQTLLLEHLEAKIPPRKHLSMDMFKEPKFTHWVSRIFALLIFIEYLYFNEMEAFRSLNMSKRKREVMQKKISQLQKERIALLGIMKSKKDALQLEFSDEFKKESRKLMIAARI